MNVKNNKKELNECTYSIKQVFYVLGKKKKKYVCLRLHGILK